MRFSVSLILPIALLAAIVSGAVFEDGFDVPRDFLVEGVEGSGWDGLVGLDPGQTVDVLNASMSRKGMLYNGLYKRSLG